MIQLRELSLARGGKPLLEGVNLTLHAGQKVGVVGPNGCGKTSLLLLLKGECHQEAGDVDLPPGLMIASVSQDAPTVLTPALDYVLDGDSELRQVEEQLKEAEEARDGHRTAALFERYEHIDGYSARARASALLHGLGFADADFDRPAAQFSGGWRVRLNLARALMCRSDLLLLDEPTNHLDLEAVVWLESWLRSYRGTLLLISHDREVLDNTVSHILQFENEGLKLYNGNYSDFERQRAAALGQQQSMYEKQQREITHLRRFVDRFRAKATKARQAQSRIKTLARMTELAPAHVDTPFTFGFREPDRNPDPLLLLEEADCSYGADKILTGVKLTLRAGQRVGLLGPNGAGKSTLIKLLAGVLAPISGSRREGKGLRIGYFAQHQLEQLRPEETPLEHIARLDPNAREQELRDYVGSFAFGGDMADRAIGPFSGGEKSRLALALLIWQRPNLLLLDEPTNHLDLEMRHALTLALQDYVGGLVTVSHDRHLLRATTDELLLVAGGRAEFFGGDLDDYREWLSQRRTAQRPAVSDDEKRDRIKRREDEAANRQTRLAKRRPLLRELKDIDERLEVMQKEREQVERRLADPALYTAADKGPLEACAKRRAELARMIDEAEERWLALHLELETLDEP